MPSRLFDKVVILRQGESATAWLMFAYSFLAMTSYNILKPMTRSKYIDSFGADDLPWVMLAASLIIGVLMHLYVVAIQRLPRRAVLPATQGGLVVIIVTFWGLFRSGAAWVPVAFYIFGLILGLLLISQFWTLANDIYDSRQARRLFGFIGAGSSLGGALGAGITGFAVEEVGTGNLFLVSAAVLIACLVIVIVTIKRQPGSSEFSAPAEERGVGGEAFRLLRESRHLQIIALVIGFAAISAAFIEQQLMMAAAAAKTTNQEVAIAAFLGKVTVIVSLLGFVVQITLTSRIHRSLGLLFALLLLPISLGATGVVILLSGALWAPTVARVLDTSLRYSIDKTTREVLFLPLPADLKFRAKPFVDVTMDRFAKALGSVALLLLIKPWGLGLTWQQLSWVSLIVMAAWIGFAMVARREYLHAFRRMLGARELRPDAVRVDVADAATIETLVAELSSPDESSVLYAIDMLETLDKRHLVTPLLLHHSSSKVRTRALKALDVTTAAAALQWIPAVERLLVDEDADVRAAAVRALAALRGEDAPALMHQHLDDADSRVSVTAAVVLADSGRPGDAEAAEAALTRLVSDTRKSAAAGRQQAAAGLAQIRNPAFRTLLVSLIHDADVEVARQAIGSARAMGPSDWLFVPALVSLLGHRVLKGPARDALISYGEPVIPILAHFLADKHEHIWVRRHVPATLARLPSQASMDALFAALDEPDGFLRYKIVEAIESLRRRHPKLTFAPDIVEGLVFKESARYYTYLTLRYNLVLDDASGVRSLLIRALDDKLDRTLDRLYRLLGLIYPWKDVVAARGKIQQGDARARAGALEYLDNLLGGAVRKRVMPIIDEMPLADRVRHANTVLKTRPRDLEDTLAQLIHEDDPVVAASAIAFVARRRLWSLASDLEYVVSHTSSANGSIVDRSVREAAVWALAQRQAGETAPSRAGFTQLPVVELADRLRAIPLFDFVSVDELFRIAGSSRQMAHEPGRMLYEEGAPAEDLQFLLAGSVRAIGISKAPRVVSAPAVLAFEEMLEGRPMRHTITAAEPAVCLRLDGSDFLTMLSDNIVLAQGLFRMLLTAPGARQWSGVQVLSGVDEVTAPRNRPLDPIEKARLLRRNPLLGRATVEQLLDLVAVTRDVPLETGSVLFGENDQPAMYHVLDGEVRIEGEDAPLVAPPGGTIGVAETLAGVSSRRRAMVTRGGHALRLDHDELFAVLSDHLDLLQGLFSGVLSQEGSMEAGASAPARRRP